MDSKPKIALVLSGGAARGAYEAGVISYLRDGLTADTGVRARFDILCGTSVGAINACFLAANAHRPDEQGPRLIEHWTRVVIDDVLRLRTTDVVRFARALLGGGPHPSFVDRHGGVIDPTALEQIVLSGAPWSSIGKNLEAGAVDALCVSATHVASGHTVHFVQSRDGTLPQWNHDPFVHPIASQIRPQHALASAAIPILFPAVGIEGQYFCDGGLRQNTPLSPALKLGADRVLVISLRHVPAGAASATERLSLPQAGMPDGVPSPYLLFGKVVNALWLDHVDYDLDRLRRTNAVIEAGQRAFGGAFAERLNAALVEAGAQPLRSIPEMRVMPSRDIGAIASEYARSEGFARRVPGFTGGVLRRMANADSAVGSDLLSYLLFDGEYCQALVDLGIHDARAQREQLARFFDGG